MAICVASSCTAISLHTGQPTVTSDSASAPPSPSTHRAEPSSQVKQSIQDRAQSPAFSASVAPVDIARLWKDALNEYTGQTGADLTTDPLMIRLNECDKVEEIMDILQERTKAFGEFRNGDAKVQLLRTLSPIVTAVLALGPSETLGEGFSVVCPPANAIVGAIAVLLKATKDVSTSYDSLVELLNGISKFLERLALYGRMSLTVPMREILIKTLATVISILALATKEVELGRLKKYVRTLLGSTEVEDALKQLTRLDSAETQMIGLESLRLTYSLAVGLDELMKNGKQSTAEIKAAFENMQSSMTATGQLILELKHDSDVQKHHTWLSPPDPSVNHHLTSRSYSTGTCAWFIDGQVMGEWKTTSSLLWIHGIPGSGKSVLCTAIIEDIKRLCLIQQKSILVYFYCDFQDAAKQNVRGLLSHLLVQFSAESQYCNQLLSRLWSSHRSGSQQPSEDDLRQCLKRMLEHLADHYLYIIIDALDECPSAGLRSHRKDVLDLIQTIIGWRCRNVHMCVTSRPELDIREALDVLSPRSVSLHAEDGQADEISAYVRSVIESGPVYQRWKVQDKKLAIERLSEKANGMFRWAFCQLEMLRGCHPATIRKVLDDLPETLDETYRRELQKLDIPSWEYTHRLFQCLVVCARPLRVEELAEVLAIDFDTPVPQFWMDWRPLDPQADILSRCSSMIVIDAETKIVQFAHFSVQEYLVSQRLAGDAKDTKVQKFHIQQEHAHITLAKACLGVLLQLDDTTIPDDFDASIASPLSAYAALYWIGHAKAIGVETSIQEAMRAAFDPRKPHFRAWSRLRETDKEAEDHWIPPIPSRYPLYCASLYSLYHMTEYLLTTCAVDVNAQDWHGSALQVACAEGHFEIARLLIGHGADIEAQGNFHGTALRAASGHGHLDIARLLIELGADVKTEGGRPGAVALRAASENGHLDVARLLIEHGAGVNMVFEHFGTALQHASLFRHLDVARLLVENDANVNVEGGRLGTALQAASLGGCLEIVRLLIEHGADVNARGGEYGTALQAASARGHLEIARMLIEHDADVKATGGEHGSALVAASFCGYLELAHLLVEHGADVNAEGAGHGGMYPLQAACFCGHLEVARMLIEHGADVKMEGGLYGSALKAACSSSHDQSLKLAHLLIEHGADLKAETADGRALQAASKGGYLELACLLIEHGANVNAEGGWYGTALQAASSGGHLELARLLIEHGADVNAKGADFNGTALQAASRWGYLEVVRLLIEHGADVNAEGAGYYGPALQAASTGGHLQLAHLLIQHGANIHVKDGRYVTALHAASVEGHLEVIRLLIEYGADVNTAGGDYGPALQAAAQRGRLEVVRLLIEHGADVEMQGGRYGTALQTATTGRHLQLVRLLIDHGANVNAESGEFGTALVAACAGGYDDIARLLVKKGADVKARDSGGRTALQIAMDEDNFPDFIHFDSQYDEVRAGRRTIAALLREHGADV